MKKLSLAAAAALAIAAAAPATAETTVSADPFVSTQGMGEMGIVLGVGLLVIAIAASGDT